MKYVDGFVVAIPEDKVEAYRKIAEEGARIWKKHGALEYVECVGEDLNPEPPGGMELRTFPQLAGARPGETVIFSYIVFNSREHRDEVNAAVMNDPAMSPEQAGSWEMPYDMARMAYGGFEVIVEG